MYLDDKVCLGGRGGKLGSENFIAYKPYNSAGEKGIMRATSQL